MYSVASSQWNLEKNKIATRHLSGGQATNFFDQRIFVVFCLKTMKVNQKVCCWKETLTYNELIPLWCWVQFCIGKEKVNSSI
jgi:hypothetical protein